MASNSVCANRVICVVKGALYKLQFADSRRKVSRCVSRHGNVMSNGGKVAVLLSFTAHLWSMSVAGTQGNLLSVVYILH